MDGRLRRSERLKSKGSIDQLFKKGERVRSGKLLLLFDLSPDAGNLRAGFGVPKRKLKKAHERNRVKRLMREIFRLNKETVLPILREKKCEASCFLLFKGDEVPSHSTLKREMIQLLERWEKRIEEKRTEEGTGKPEADTFEKRRNP
ncbi:MAG: ribonuclease P protein component [Flavobacteriales bacterium]